MTSKKEVSRLRSTSLCVSHAFYSASLYCSVSFVGICQRGRRSPSVCSPAKAEAHPRNFLIKRDYRFSYLTLKIQSSHTHIDQERGTPQWCIQLPGFEWRRIIFFFLFSSPFLKCRGYFLRGLYSETFLSLVS